MCWQQLLQIHPIPDPQLIYRLLLLLLLWARLVLQAAAESVNTHTQEWFSTHTFLKWGRKLSWCPPTNKIGSYFKDTFLLFQPKIHSAVCPSDVIYVKWQCLFKCSCKSFLVKFYQVPQQCPIYAFEEVVRFYVIGTPMWSKTPRWISLQEWTHQLPSLQAHLKIHKITWTQYSW